MVMIFVLLYRISDCLLNLVDGVILVKKKEYMYFVLICIGMWLIDVSVFLCIFKCDLIEI